MLLGPSPSSFPPPFLRCAAPPLEANRTSQEPPRGVSRRSSRASLAPGRHHEGRSLEGARRPRPAIDREVARVGMADPLNARSSEPARRGSVDQRIMRAERRLALRKPRRPGREIAGSRVGSWTRVVKTPARLGVHRHRLPPLEKVGYGQSSHSGNAASARPVIPLSAPVTGAAPTSTGSPGGGSKGSRPPGPRDRPRGRGRAPALVGPGRSTSLRDIVRTFMSPRGDPFASQLGMARSCGNRTGGHRTVDPWKAPA